MFIVGAHMGVKCSGLSRAHGWCEVLRVEPALLGHVGQGSSRTLAAAPLVLGLSQAICGCH